MTRISHSMDNLGMRSKRVSFSVNGVREVSRCSRNGNEIKVGERSPDGISVSILNCFNCGALRAAQNLSDTYPSKWRDSSEGRETSDSAWNP